MSGVFWKAPGNVPNCGSGVSPVFHSHAFVRRLTFSRVMAVSAEYFRPPGSPP